MPSKINFYRAQSYVSIFNGLKVYLEPKVLIILVLGFSAGLPLALSGSTLILWMSDVGMDLTAVGLYSLVGLPYTIKFLWAPITDAFSIPVFSRLLGHRRGWLIASQILLMLAIFLLGSVDPLQSPFLIALAAILVAFASATQDIVIDAFRVESLDEDQQAAGMAYYVAAYRIGLLVSGAGVIVLVAYLEKIGISPTLVWGYGFYAMAALVIIGMVAVLFAKEPGKRDDPSLLADNEQTGESGILFRFWKTAMEAFSDFLTKPGAVFILLFVVLFKLGDAVAGVMTGPFVLAIGFEKATYAGIVKGVGLAAALIGGFLGGLIVRSFSLYQGLWIGGVLQLVSNLFFCWLVFMGTSHSALATTIVVENLAGGIGTVIFVAYLSGLCDSPAHTATQFALLTALSAVGRTFLSSSSGFIAEGAGWFWFFGISAIMAIPGLILLYFLKNSFLSKAKS